MNRYSNKWLPRHKILNTIIESLDLLRAVQSLYLSVISLIELLICLLDNYYR